MRCPKCGMQLVEIDYKGIKIDRCTGCTGVWLDAGELEQVAELEHAGLKKFSRCLNKLELCCHLPDGFNKNPQAELVSFDGHPLVGAVEQLLEIFSGLQP